MFTDKLIQQHQVDASPMSSLAGNSSEWNLGIIVHLKSPNVSVTYAGYI
jgi:hypothetical protein